MFMEPHCESKGYYKLRGPMVIYIHELTSLLFFAEQRYMPAVLSISENLLRSSLNHPIVTRTASTLYTAAFEISDAYYRQEIVGSLLVHIGSGSAVEIDASLLVLRSISQHSRSILREYSVFIKGVLDYLDNLSLEQIRLLFIVLGSLAREVWAHVCYKLPYIYADSTTY